MKLFKFKLDISKSILLLLVLVASTSTVFASGINVSTSTVAVNCSLVSSTVGSAVNITVTLAASPTSAVTIGNSTTPSSSPIVITQNVAGAVGTTLASAASSSAALYSTGVVFAVNAQPYCANATATGANTVTFNFTGTGGLTSASVTVTLTVNGGAFTQNATPTNVSLSCNLANGSGSAYNAQAQSVVVKLAAAPPAGTSVTFAAGTYTTGTGGTLASVTSGTSPLVVTVPATALTSSNYNTGITVTVNSQPYCANVASTGASTAGFTLTGTVSGGITGETVTSQAIAVGLTVSGGSLTQTVTPSTSVTLSCNTGNSGAAYTAQAQTITVALTSAPPAGTSITFAAGTYTTGTGGTLASVTSGTSPLVVTVPATALTSSNYSSGIVVSINSQPFCANIAQPGASTAGFTLSGTATGGISGVTVGTQAISVSLTVSAGPSPLTVSPSAISINCTWDGTTGASHYTPGEAQFISVTGPASPAQAFTVNTSTSTSTALAWATLSPAASSISNITAGVSPYNFTVVPTAGCGAVGSYTSKQGTIHLTNSPNLDKVITVTLNIVHGTPLQVSLSKTALTYVKGSGTPGYVDAQISDITGSAGYYFTVDTTSLPTWLTVDSTSGTTPRSIRFSSTSIADTMAPGSYSQAVRIQTQGYGDLLVTIAMQLSNPASTLSVTGTPVTGCTVTGPTQSCNWTIGQPLPTLYINLKSSDAAIPYTITTGGTLAPIIATAELGGLAYNFGTSIPVNFSQSVFSGVSPGTMVSGTVTITSGSPATNYVVTFNITAEAPGAILTGISPMIVPVLSAGQQVQVVLEGTGFVKSTDPTQATTVGIVSGGVFTTDTNFNVSVLNASNILLTITVPSVADPLLNFATATTFPVVIGVCNPDGSSCSTPTGTVTLTIGANPIIQTVTSASAYVQSASNPPVAPYDIISIFGTNLCATCSGSNAVMFGTPQSPNLNYPTWLSNTDALNVTRTLQVAFQTHAATTSPSTSGGPSITTTYAPLLFATNNQINLLVPSAVAGAAASGNHLVDLEVSFGPSGSPVLSNPFPVTIVTADPGIFTIGADGTGNGAVLDQNYDVVGQSNPATMHATATSATVSVYMTGLGAPLSSADNTAAATDGGYVWSADCIAATGASGYTSTLGAQTGAGPSTADGLILQSSLLNTGRLVPCLTSSAQAPTVTIGGVAAASVGYAGWVADAVAGLYQVNATLPSDSGTFYTATTDCVNFSGATTITQATQLPICVTSAGGRPSQGGVMIWVAPKLPVAAPTAASGTPVTLTEQVGAACGSTGQSVVASEGTGPYTYVLTSGVLPLGLSLSSSGALTGTPALGTVGSYPITVTATDSSTIPLTGTVSFVVQVNGGLFVSSSVATSGVSQATITTAGSGTATVWTTSSAITATTGSGSYTYSVQSGTLPSGLTLNATTGTVTGTPASPSSATVVFEATDNSTGLTGTVSVIFNIT